MIPALPPDVADALADLERRIGDLEAARRLVAATIGSGGLTVAAGGEITVEGGKVVIKDAGGTTVATLGTAGLDLAGTLVVDGTISVDGGQLVVKDAGGTTVLTLATSGMTLAGLLEVAGGLDIQDEAEVKWYDDAGNLRFEIGRRDEGAVANTQLVYIDEAGTTRAVIGELDVGHGILVRGAGGDGLLAATETDGFQVARPGTPFDVILRVNAADGLRVAVDTAADGIQSGKVTAGAADSGGAGFRMLRIPN